MSRIPLAQLPTPLEEAPRLSEALGVRLLVKRDDLTGLALGGNKARKLEHLVADACAQGCDTLIAAGGLQSNFARMTAAAAARVGMRCHLVLGGHAPERVTGNLVLDHIFGATLHFVGSGDWRVLEAGVEKLAQELGRGAYPMPIGGATAVGALGYVHAADEIVAQLPALPDWLVVADGSGGTHAGLLAALPASIKILGIDVARPPVPHRQRIPSLAAQTAQLAGRPLPGGELHLSDHTGTKYGSVTQESIDAIHLAARTEGLLLDPVYSGKALAGLRAAIRGGLVSGTVVFLHTGGAPALFADGYAEVVS